MRRTLGDPSRALFDLGVRSIGQVNDLLPQEREEAYRCLIPLDLTLRFEIDSATLATGGERRLFHISPGSSSVELSLQHAPDAEDPVLYLQLADTAANQIEVVLFIINDPHSERFDTDRLPDGTPTYFGTQGRNIQEELAAMRAGLAPGQVRAGLRLARDLVPILERFVCALRHDAFYVQPLAYHNAIQFEHLGFGYAVGRGRMEWIHCEFAPGGLLHSRLDGSTPFRAAGAESTVRGRSWAIHDGVTGMPFAGVKMYKRVALHAGVATFPNARW